MENYQKYYCIKRSYEPSVIGLNDASAQVEILNKKTKHSFANENEWLYFNDYSNSNRKNTSRVSMDDFLAIDNSKIERINLIKTKKRVKEVDIMYYLPRYIGFDIVFSRKLLDAIEKYSLSNFNKLNATVEDFNTEYYIIGLPLIDFEKIDFPKSTFFASFRKGKYVFKNYEDYKNHSGLIEAEKIVLNTTYEYDVLKIPFGIYFSERLVNEIEKLNLVALEINKAITLENCTS
jgi:hypothetical protein